MQISYDRRAILIDGKRTPILSGAIHYPRSTPAMWADLMTRSRDAGLNTIETYVFWNLHERHQGVFDFSERLDLVRFCQMAQEHGLYVILRIGPYICAETNYGGLPFWLRDIPGMEIRTDNEPFKREMERWVRLVCEMVQPLFAPNGGPIILAQIENEYNNIGKNYGDAGQKYLQWSVDFAQELNIGIPWVTCVGSAEGSIETMNAFQAHTSLEDHFTRHPDQPALWTENWPGWYDTWGYTHHLRDASEIAYAVARFFAAGGTGVNYYMWHGGTNFGRETMYLQTTSYDFDAPLDEFGLPTNKSQHLARLHEVLNAYAQDYVEHDLPTEETLGPKQMAFVYASGLTFLANDDVTDPASVTFGGQEYTLVPQSVLVMKDNQILFDTSDQIRAMDRQWLPIQSKLTPFVSWSEPMPEKWPAALRSAVTADKPIEQLALTQDDTDYCWYEIDLTVSEQYSGAGKLTFDRVADVVHIYVDGQFEATSKTPLIEDRGAVESDGFKQEIALTLSSGTHRLSVLCCAVGLIKGDWMIGDRNMVEERKGIWGPVRWNGVEITGQWQLQPGLVGERCAIFADAGSLIPWSPSNRTMSSLTWCRTTFDRPAEGGELALDANGLNKGILWLNGRCLGRYWLTDVSESIAPWQAGSVQSDPNMTIIQRYYHVPLEWLADTNTLVLLEEIGGDASSVHLVKRV